MERLLTFEGTLTHLPRGRKPPRACFAVVRLREFCLYSSQQRASRPMTLVLSGVEAFTQEGQFGFSIEGKRGSSQVTERFLTGSHEQDQRQWLRAINTCLQGDKFESISSISMRRLKGVDWVKIGEGTFGRVYRASYDGTLVAIKQFKFELNEGDPADQENAVAFASEVGMLSSINHTNLVRFYGIAVENQHYHVVTELCENGDLSQLIHKWDAVGMTVLGPNTPIPLSDQRRMALEIFNGLSFLHEQNVIHRDLKPQNILLDRFNTVKIADLGQSTAQARTGSHLTAAPGTPLYQAPEVMPSQHIISAQYCTSADIYAVGLIVYEMFTQKIPFISDNESFTPSDISREVCRGLRPVLPADCPPGLVALIRRCWHQDPAARPVAQKAAELMRAPSLFDPFVDAPCTDVGTLFDAVVGEYWLWHDGLRDTLGQSIRAMVPNTAPAEGQGEPEPGPGPVPEPEPLPSLLLDAANSAAFVAVIQRHLHEAEAQRVLMSTLMVLAHRCSEAQAATLCDAGLVQRLSDVFLIHQSRLEILMLAATAFELVIAKMRGRALAGTDVGCVVINLLKRQPAARRLVEAGTNILLQLSGEEMDYQALVEAGLVDVCIGTILGHPSERALVSRAEQLLRIVAADQEHAELIRRKCTGNELLEGFCVTLPEPHEPQAAQAPERVYNIVLLGTAGAGKTSLFRRFFSEGFSEAMGSTYGLSSNYRRMNLHGQRIILNINDTAGQERYQALGPLYYRECHGALLVYRVDQKQSFEKVTTFLDNLKAVSPDATICMAGNACDLPRQVSEAEARAFAEECGATYIETSAKENAGVSEILVSLAERTVAEQEGVLINAPRRSSSADLSKPPREEKPCWIL